VATDLAQSSIEYSFRHYDDLLQLLFEEINRLQDEHEVRSHRAKSSEYFAAKQQESFLRGSFWRSQSSENTDVALSIEHNPGALFSRAPYSCPRSIGDITKGLGNHLSPSDHWHVMADRSSIAVN